MLLLPYFYHIFNNICGAQGMLRSVAVAQYFKDLRNEAYTTAFAVYHRRFSTNTTPRWPLAQPMRTLGHNGTSLPAPCEVCA